MSKALFQATSDAALPNTTDENNLDLTFEVDVAKLVRVEIRVNGTVDGNSRGLTFQIFEGPEQTSIALFDGLIDTYLPIKLAEAVKDLGDSAVTYYAGTPDFEYAGWRRHSKGWLFRDEMTLRIQNRNPAAANVIYFAAECEELIALPGGGYG